jgi:excisionase family DNA binding protein
MEKALNSKEVCGVLGVSWPTVSYLIKTGKLRPVRVGKRKWCFPVPEVQRYLRGGEVEVRGGQDNTEMVETTR